MILQSIAGQRSGGWFSLNPGLAPKESGAVALKARDECPVQVPAHPIGQDCPLPPKAGPRPEHGTAQAVSERARTHLVPLVRLLARQAAVEAFASRNAAGAEIAGDRGEVQSTRTSTGGNAQSDVSAAAGTRRRRLGR